MCKHSIVLVWIILGNLGGHFCEAQVLTLKDAVRTALDNYPVLKAKAHYVRASEANVKFASREYLPNLSVSGQQDYGTINGINGPVYSYRGLTVASSGPVFPTQNNTAAFGALYLANVDWDFFSFGHYKEKVRVASSILAEDTSDLYQARFEQEVEVAGAYLNLLAARALIRSEASNLERAEAVQRVVLARVKGQLNPGVDSSQANAEVSSARIELTNAREFAEEKASELAQLMGVPAGTFTLDTTFLARIPGFLQPSAVNPQDHPLLRYYRSRIQVSEEETKFLKTDNFPVFSLFGVAQGRGSGFAYNYGNIYPDAYSKSYGEGVGIQRTNYLLGVGLTWNLTTPLRVHEQIAAQRFTSLGLADEYELINQQLAAQRVLADTRIHNALNNYKEAPVQVKAASDAYNQKSVLYKNGLANIVDLTQTLFVLNRAETDQAIADNNVWQALLLKAAATGDWNMFINEF